MSESFWRAASKRIAIGFMAAAIAACGEAPRGEELVEQVKETTQDVADDVSDATKKTGEQVKGATKRVGDTARQGADKAAQGGNEAWDGAKDAGSDAWDSTKEAGNDAWDGAQQGADAARDGAQRAGQYATDTARDAQQAGSEAADDISRTAQDVSDHARSAAETATEWVSELETPVLEQRKEKCAQEDGYWAEKVEVGPCTDGHASVDVDGTKVDQECEGDGPGQSLTGQCVHRTKPYIGTFYFNDGPSTPHYLQRFGELMGDRSNFLQWNEVFWDAAVNHDYCYHHGQITYGYEQKDCDEQFIDDMLALCRSDRGREYAWFDEETCMQNAQGMFGAVRQFGAENFGVMNTLVHYPEYTPMFDKLGVTREDEDKSRRERIESLTF